MRAVAVVPGRPESVGVVEVPAPEPRPNEALVRVRQVAFDGTDTEVLHGAHGQPPPGEEALVLGHEALGEVVALGPQARGLAVGDLVVPLVRRPCPHPWCPACPVGRPDFCLTGDYTERGIKGRHGFAAEFLTEEPRYLVPVPRALEPVGILLEPLSIVVKALEQAETAQRRLPWAPRRAIVLGAGPIGLLAVLLLRLRDLETRVISRGRRPDPRADVAEAAGARYVSGSAPELRAMAGEADVIVEATGYAPLALEAMAAVGTNGVVVLLSVGGQRQATVDAAAINNRLVLGNGLVVGSVNAARAHFEEGVRVLEAAEGRWPGLLGRLVTRRVGLEGWREALEGDSGVKTVLEPGE